MLAAILICAFMVKNVATQRTANATLGTKSCVLIGHDVKLLCTVSADCCTSLQRVWEKGSAITLLDDGISTLDPSKYEEDYDNGTTGFNLIIKNVQTSDFGVNYKCLYGATESALFYLDDILCPPSDISGNCLKCAGKDYGWSILGTVIGTGIMIIAKVIIRNIAKDKKFLCVCDMKSVIRDGLSFIISAVVNAIFALPIGYYMCHCVDGTEMLSIILGLCTSLILGVILLIYKWNKGDDVHFVVECCCIVLGAACSESCKVLCTGSSQGSNGSNEQPLKENKKKKPAAEKSSNEPPLEKKKKKKSAAETGSNEPPLEKKKKKKSAAETGSRSPTAAAKHIKTANNETEMIPTEKGFSGDLEKKRPLPPLTTQLSPTNRPIPLPSSTKPLPSSTRPLPQITTNKGDN